MTHAGHAKVVCSCGTVIAQCRCPDANKQVDVRERACPRCRGAASGEIGAQPAEELEGDTVQTRPHEIVVRVDPLVVPEASPPLKAWQVVVETSKTEWRETFGSEDALQAFIRGVRAGAAARGCFDVHVPE